MSRRRAASQDRLLGVDRRLAELERTIDYVAARLGSPPPARGPRAHAEAPAGEATIVVPVYDAHDDVRRCLDSVLARTRGRYRLLVIDDASPDPRIPQLLRGYAAAHAHVEVIEHQQNRGYTATINEGCRRAPGDVVLLNSDTEVPEDWLGRLARVAYSRPDVVTVTPLSNAAGAFSVPEAGTHDLPPGLDVQAMAALLERVSRKARPAVPTGNGFCLFVKRAAFEAVGYFDEERFPRGYGEENDFCLRASEAGFAHLIDDATFVFHRRNASFGAEKAVLVERAKGLVSELHPRYPDQVAAFLADPALKALRCDLRSAVAAGAGPARPTVLIVLHDGGGGLPKANGDLVRSIGNQFDCIVLRCGLQQWRLERLSPETEELERIAFAEPWHAGRPIDGERVAALRRICEEHGVRLAHVRSLLATGPELLTHLADLELPIVFSFHDFQIVCPTGHLMDGRNRYCAGRCAEAGGDCRPAASWFRHPLPGPLRDGYVHEWRARMADGLRHCHSFITTSVTARDVIVEHFPFVGSRLHIVAHGRDVGAVPQVASRPVPGELQRVVAFGALSYAKGIELIDWLLQLDARYGRRFAFHVLGNRHGRWHPEQHGAIVHGEYERDQLPAALAEIAPSYALMASVQPETYSHTLTEAWMCGLPVLASDIGTLRERVGAAGGGWLLNYGEPEAFYGEMCRIAEALEEWDARRAEVGRMRFRTVDEMGATYRAVYEDALGARPRRSRRWLGFGRRSKRSQGSVARSSSTP